MRRHYRREDLSTGVRGKYHTAYLRRTNLVLLQPEVAAVFRTPEAVNQALKTIIEINSGSRIARAATREWTKDRSGVKLMTKHFRKGLDGRQRDQDGEIRQKRSDTMVGTLRKTYGDDFASGYRSNTRLGTVLRKEGVETLDQLRRKR